MWWAIANEIMRELLFLQNSKNACKESLFTVCHYEKGNKNVDSCLTKHLIELYLVYTSFKGEYLLLPLKQELEKSDWSTSAFLLLSNTRKCTWKGRDGVQKHERLWHMNMKDNDIWIGKVTVGLTGTIIRNPILTVWFSPTFFIYLFILLHTVVCLRW